MPTTKKILLSTLAGLTLAGSVAACAPSNDSTGSSSSESSSPPAGEAGTNSSASADTTTSGYTDGTYSADGSYTSPNGQETVGVTLTLADGTVTDVQITEHPSNPNTEKFQEQFASGISEVVVGKKLDELQVSVVSGSSLTSAGFNDAVDAIKTQAS